MWTLKRIARAEYIQLQEIRAQLFKDEPIKWNKSELEAFRKWNISPDIREKKTTKGYRQKNEDEHSDQEESPSHSTHADDAFLPDSKTMRSLIQKTSRTDKVYEHLYLYPVHEQTRQRLASIKRQAMKAILGLERELRRINRERLLTESNKNKE